ncbi:MAG: cob(I)yrinic acid a,c-diamide adenosyltransferase [Candidatus Delongbacteria bacterium]|nr:cob(I)yrinic acid a,c-diamide adenosyltransferase [Candidatus Delongbacteria bacterium]
MGNGQIIINTGDGKGKSTAAFGTITRALGHGKKVCVIQFIKSPGEYGEVKFFREQKNVEWHISGRGFTWNSEDIEKDKEIALEGFELAKEKINSGDYDLIVLDEITYVTNYKFIDTLELINTIKNRPENVDIILTGRNADSRLIEIADTVTEMLKIKHSYDSGIKAKKGIEY